MSAFGLLIVVAGMLAAMLLGAAVMFVGLRGVSPSQIAQGLRGAGQWFGRGRGMSGSGSLTGSPSQRQQRQVSVPIEPGLYDAARRAAEEYKRPAAFADYDDLALAEAFDKMLVARMPDDVDEVMGET